MKKIFTLLSLAVLVAGKVSAQVPSPTITVTNATVCTAPCNGMATATTQTVTGMTFLWSTTPPQTSNTAVGLCPGAYSCTITLAPFGSTSGTCTVTCASAVNEITVDDNISVYPNPTHQELNLQSDNVVSGKVTLLIRNILGAVVYREIIELNGTLSRKVDVSILPQGIYDVQLINGSRITRKQFVRE